MTLKVQTIVCNIFYFFWNYYVKMPWLKSGAMSSRANACMGILWFMQVETEQQEKGFPAWLFFLVGIVAVWIIKAIVDKYLKKISAKPKNGM